MCVFKYLVLDALWWHRGWGTPARKFLSSLLDSSWVVVKCVNLGAFAASLDEKGSYPVWVVLHQFCICDEVCGHGAIITASNTWNFIYLIPLLYLSFLSLLTYHVYIITLNTTLPLIPMPYTCTLSFTISIWFKNLYTSERPSGSKGLTLMCKARAQSHPNAIFHSFQVQEAETQDMETIHCKNKQSHTGTVEWVWDILLYPSPQRKNFHSAMAHTAE